jgi:hypothetical protein
MLMYFITPKEIYMGHTPWTRGISGRKVMDIITTLLFVNMLVIIALVPLPFPAAIPMALAADDNKIAFGGMDVRMHPVDSVGSNNSSLSEILQYKIIEITSPKNGTWFRDAASVNGDQTYVNMTGYAAYLSSPVEARTPEPVLGSNLSWYVDNQFIGNGSIQSVLLNTECDGQLQDHTITMVASFPDGIKKSASVTITTGGIC